MSAPARTEEDITTGLMSLIAWAGNATSACRALKAEGKLDIKPSTLLSWSRERYADRYAELREKYQAQLEAQTIAHMDDVVRLALDGQRLAIERTTARLKQGKDPDPARTAANLATVSDKMTSKKLALQGRPTQITESRNLGEIMRSLVAKGVLQLPEEAQAVEVGE